MRRFYGALTVLLVLLALSLYNGYYAKQLTSQIASELTKAQEYAASDQWDLAATHTKTAHELWDAHDFYLHVSMRHTDTDNILLSLQAVEEAIALEEADQYRTSNAQLITQLQLLAEMEAPSLQNIF